MASSGEETKVSEGSDTVSSHSIQSPQKKTKLWRRIFNIVNYTPKRCRYNPDKPFEFSMALNLLFAFAGTFTVANLYYSHPILNKLADDFNVNQERVSLIPTLAQAGYGSGLLFVVPISRSFSKETFCSDFGMVHGYGLDRTLSYEFISSVLFLLLPDGPDDCNTSNNASPRW